MAKSLLFLVSAVLESLDEYIRQQRDAGSVESAGSFTLAIEKARDKLGSYTLANQEDYILKIVQCGVCLGLPRLHVQFTRSTVLVYFEIDQDDRTLSVDNLTNSLLTPLEEKNPARSYLALALCSVAGMEPVELMWGDWDGESTALILSLGHGRSELFRSVPFPRTEPLESGKRFHLLYLKKRSSQKLPLSLTAPEQQVLRERCSFSPLPIEVDGQELEAQLPVYFSTSDPVRQLTDLYLGSLALEGDEEGAIFWKSSSRSQKSYSENFKTTLPDDLTRLSNKLPPVFRFCGPGEWKDEERTVRLKRVLGFPCYLYGPSRIHFLKDGVLLDPVTVHDAGGGGFGILDGNHLTTDVSGLQVVRDEKVEAEIESTVQAWRNLVDDFIDGNPPLFKSTIVSSTDEAFWFVFGCCLIGPLASIFKPFLEYFIQSERTRAIQLKRFHRQLQTRRGYLAFFRESRSS